MFNIEDSIYDLCVAVATATVHFVFCIVFLGSVSKYVLIHVLRVCLLHPLCAKGVQYTDFYLSSALDCISSTPLVCRELTYRLYRAGQLFMSVLNMKSTFYHAGQMIVFICFDVLYQYVLRNKSVR